jgi:hypothetical protein
MGRLTFPYGTGVGIGIAEGFFLNDTIEKILLLATDALDEVGHAGRTGTGGTFPEAKHTTDISLSGWSHSGQWSKSALLEVGYDVDDLDRSVSRGVGDIINAYSSVFDPGTRDVVDTGYLIQRYRRGSGFYIPHVDSNASCALARLLSIVIYLNTVDVGGETGFPRHEVAVSPVQGRAVVFPSNFIYEHEARIPISDDKYVITTFIEAAYPVLGDPSP